MELPDGDGDWLAPSPSPSGPAVPDRHGEHEVGTFIWPPLGTATWPPLGTFSWPRTIVIADLATGRHAHSHDCRPPTALAVNHLAGTAPQLNQRTRIPPYEADRLAALRRARPGRGKLRADPELAQYVQQHLDKRWSPAQISYTLPTMFPADPARHLTPETIYQAIYRTGSGVRRPHRRPWLRIGRRYRRRRIPVPYRPRRLADMVLIDHRPNIVDRAEPGHWEGDLIMGTGNRSAIGTLVERSTRYTILLHLDGRRSAESVRDAVIAAMSTLPPHLRRSLTWDQGNEMAYHQHISAALSMPVYFCHPRSPWQRPTNEHINGLLRQYFPKRTDLNQHAEHHLAAVAHELNTRPRKILNWDSPAKRFTTINNTPVLQQ